MTSAAFQLAEGAEPFPGYRLLAFLGRGGWGEVWMAEMPGGRRVALKFLPCDNPLTAATEIRALQAIRHLEHPNLIKIEQIWCLGHYLVTAMELADGTLLDLLNVYFTEFGKGMIPHHLCFFLAQAAAALDFLNTRQHMLNGVRVAVRHCDVKPSNLLVVGQTVKVADFSLAAPTTSGMWYHRRCGTLNYAAPEMFQGRLSDRTDQYALAISYCELRSGRFPFPNAPTRFEKTYQRPPPDLSMLSAAERPIVNRALLPVPQDRWPSCTELFQELTRVVGRQAAVW